MSFENIARNLYQSIFWSKVTNNFYSEKLALNFCNFEKNTDQRKQPPNGWQKFAQSRHPEVEKMDNTLIGDCKNIL
jgi:hypothetical protein